MLSDNNNDSYDDVYVIWYIGKGPNTTQQQPVILQSNSLHTSMLAQARSTGGASTLAGGPFPSTARQMLDPLEREQREIEKRRQREAERVKRVLHAKTRTMGVIIHIMAWHGMAWCICNHNGHSYYSIGGYRCIGTTSSRETRA